MRLARPIGPAMYLALFELILAILSVLRIASGSCQSQFFMSSQTSLRFKGPDSARKIQYLSVSQTVNNTSTTTKPPRMMNPSSQPPFKELTTDLKNILKPEIIFTRLNNVVLSRNLFSLSKQIFL